MSAHARGIRARKACAGVTLVEVLVAVIVTMIGLLGVVALQMRAYASETESYQRSQAAILLEDMASRVRANAANAATYVGEDIGAGDVEDCAEAGTLSAKDLCEWGNLLRGAAETHDGTSVGAMAAGRACISQTAPNFYVITVAWEGTVPTAAPAATCGEGEFANENLRRALSTVVRIATLGA